MMGNSVMDRRSVMARHHVMGGRSVLARPNVMGGRGVMVGGGVRRPQPPLRLTRRGRAVVLGLLVVVASLCSAVLFTTASRAEGEPAGPPPTHVVQPGDTLWDIAAQQMPRQDGQRAVDELRRLNDMPDYAVAPGEILILPRAS